ncbi:hypothetical protein BGX24_011118 [Mortierella sp. AD032]|nr:hypothetical protein BGX24_011118 [Mortierella sp. AD032]
MSLSPLVRAIRPIPQNSRETPTASDLANVRYVATNADRTTKDQFILWSDIKATFHDALHVRHQTRVVPFLKDAVFVLIKPHRITAIPDVVLDVVVGDAIPTVAVATTSTIVRDPAYGIVEEAMQNYTHIDNPAAESTPGALQTAMDEQSFSSDGNDTLQSPHSSNNNNRRQAPQVPQEIPSPTAGSEETTLDSVQIMVNANQDLRQDYRAAMDWCLKAAEQGVSEAQFRIGELYNSGCGVTQDRRRALEWYLKAAEQGHSEAMCGIGCLYRKGEGGVSQDFRKAAEWFVKAVVQESTFVKYCIGLLHHDGSGVPKNYGKTKRWFLKAAIEDCESSLFAMGELYNYGHGVSRNYSEAMAWYFLTAKKSHIGAPYSIAHLHYKGLGVPRDYLSALQ